MTTYSNNQKITGKEASEILARHGFSFIGAINGDILDFDGVTDPFEPSDEAEIIAGVSNVIISVEKENFVVFLNSTAKMHCGDIWVNNWTCNTDPVWTIEA